MFFYSNGALPPPPTFFQIKVGKHCEIVIASLRVPPGDDFDVLKQSHCPLGPWVNMRCGTCHFDP